MMNTNTEATVLLADDHLMFRQGVKALLEAEGFKIVGEAADGHEAIRLARKHKPQIAVLDYNMPTLNGIDAATEIQKHNPLTELVLLTMFDDEMYALEALRCGIRGIVLKNQAATDLVHALRQVMNGSVYLSPGNSESVVKALLTDQHSQSEKLTVREKQILQLVAEGYTSKQIARLLHLSVKTAETHRSRIMSKLDIHNTANLVRYAIRRGVIQA